MSVYVHTVPSGSDRLCIIHQEDSSVSLSLRSLPVFHDSQAASKQPVCPAGFPSSSPPSYTHTASLSGLCALMSLLSLVYTPPSSCLGGAREERVHVGDTEPNNRSGAVREICA